MQGLRNASKPWADTHRCDGSCGTGRSSAGPDRRPPTRSASDRRRCSSRTLYTSEGRRGIRSARSASLRRQRKPQPNRQRAAPKQPAPPLSYSPQPSRRPQRQRQARTLVSKPSGTSQPPASQPSWYHSRAQSRGETAVRLPRDSLVSSWQTPYPASALLFPEQSKPRTVRIRELAWQRRRQPRSSRRRTTSAESHRLRQTSTGQASALSSVAGTGP